MKNKLNHLVVGALATTTCVFAELEVETPGPTVSKPAINVPKPAGAARKPGEESDLLKFKNNDLLHGDLISVTPDGGLRWRHADAKDVITFALSNLAEIKLAHRSAGPPQQTRASIRLTNRDEITGEVVSLNKENLVLNTWYAGQMTIKRSMVECISPNLTATATIYSGPTGLDGWTQRGNQDGWKYKKGAFYSFLDSYLARDVKLPDSARIDFQAAWRRYPYFHVAFYTTTGEDFYGNGYMIQFSGTQVYLQRGSARRGTMNIGNPVNLESLQRKNKGTFSLLVNKPKKTFSLLIDGELVKQWTDPDEFAGQGTAVLFYGRGGENAIKISQIHVSEWDGKLETDAGSSTPEQEDLVRFVNNDKVSGTLDSIAKGEITFTTSYATLKIPLERATQISLAASKAEKARRQSADVRAHFGEGGRVTVALEKLDEKGLSGSSENFGRLNFALDGFSRLQFRIYDEPEEGATDEDWAF